MILQPSIGGGLSELTIDTSTISSIFNTRTLTPHIKKITINVTSNSAITATSAFTLTNGVDEVIVNDINGVGLGGVTAFLYNSGIRSITLNTVINNNASYNVNTIKNNSNLESILGTPLDMTFYSNEASDTLLNMNPKLVTVRFVPNTLHYRFNLNQNEMLSDETLVSLANCLDASVSKTLTLHTNALARLPLIVGTVTNGTFVIDPTGTTTLQSFITTTKGWTIA